MRYLPLHRTKRSKPFGKPNTPFDPRTGSYLPLPGAEPLFQTVTLETEHGEFLMCLDADGRKVMVAKPYLFRRFVFDGETVDGVVYTFLRDDYRKAVAEDDATIEEFQFLTPSYYAGEALVVAKARTEVHVDSADNVVVCLLIDMNTAGRCWAVGDEEEEA